MYKRVLEENKTMPQYRVSLFKANNLVIIE